MENANNNDIVFSGMKKIFAKLKENDWKPFEYTFTPDMLAEGDTWLLQVAYYGKSETLTFTNNCILFNNDDPMRYDEVPESFYRTINKNF